MTLGYFHPEDSSMEYLVDPAFRCLAAVQKLILSPPSWYSFENRVCLIVVLLVFL
jgi:hypothetical protein